MNQQTENNKRVAKNTLYLYIRMFVSLLVGLYTSRVILQTLGVSDYGIYDVMGGVIGMLYYVNNLISGGSSRFLTIDLGRGDLAELKRTFSMINTLAVIAASIVLLLGETVGLWFMNTQLNIDSLRMDAANWVYQCALLTCCVTILQSPYTATIIAHEEMSIYAYMSIFDVVMKLLIVFMLTWFGVDKLKLYGSLMFCVTFLGYVMYCFLCRSRFQECRFIYSFQNDKFRTMMSYSGWNMVGGFANVLNNYGINILINIFFGTTVNAARGIAMQVNNIVSQFYTNIHTASRPQIFKYYAQNDIDGMSNLICNTSKYCALLLLCIIVPVAINIDRLLYIWLGQYPEYTNWFIRLLLIQVVFYCLDYPIGMGIHAVGKMKLPNLSSAFLYLSVFPLTWIIYHLGGSPVLGFCVFICFTPIIMSVDLYILNKYTNFNVKRFIIETLLPVLSVSCVSVTISILIAKIISGVHFTYTLVNVFLSGLTTLIIVYHYGLSSSMRKEIIKVVKNKINRK